MTGVNQSHSVMYIFMGGLKRSYDDIFAVDDYFDKSDLSTATMMEEMCRLQGSYIEK